MLIKALSPSPITPYKTEPVAWNSAAVSNTTSTNNAASAGNATSASNAAFAILLNLPPQHI